MQYKLIIFDWDGTLMDSLNKIVNTFSSTAQEMEMPLREPNQIRHTIGLGLHAAFSRLYPDMDWQQLNHAVSLYRKYWLADNQTPSLFYPSVMDGLNDLVEKGYMLAVATGKSRAGLNRMLDEYQLHNLFFYSRCADETQPKPDPAMLLDILAYSGLAPEHCVMIGDTTFDMEMAQKAGIDAIGVSYGSHPTNMLNQFSPKQVVDNFDQLLSLFCAEKN